MSRQHHNWMQTLVVIGTILPVIFGMGVWILSRSNSQAVIADKVSDQDQEIKALQKQLYELQLQQAREECRRP